MGSSDDSSGRSFGASDQWDAPDYTVMPPLQHRYDIHIDIMVAAALAEL